MNQVFLIIAHRNPEQLSLLMKQLESSESYFFIHIDLKSDIKLFEQYTNEINNVKFIKERYRLVWGAFGIVKAIYALMSDLIQSKLIYSHAHILSGEDISIRPIDNLNNFFSENSNKNFLEFFKLPHDHWNSGGLNRVERYYFGLEVRNVSKAKIYFNQIMDLLVNDILANIFPFIKKKIPDNIELYGGSAWFSLNKVCIEWVVDNANKNRKLLQFFKTAFIPDEFIFQTILLNSKLSSTICNDNKRYIDWVKSKNGSPTTLVNSDYQVLKNSNCFFARKVDFENGKQLYNLFSKK